MTSANRSSASTPRSSGIDFLRAVCILYVVGYWHLIPYTSALPGYANWLTEGLKYVALSTFVLCSGYLLAGQDVRLSPAGLWRFYRRRLLRIYPPYALAVLLFALAGIASLAQAIDGALLISMFHPPALPTLWFVTMIVVFYLIAPVLIRLADRPLLAVLATLGCMGLLAAEHLLVAPIDLRILMYLPVFLLGILYRRWAALGDLIGRQPAALAVAAVLLLPTSTLGNESSVAGALLLLPLLLTSAVAMLIFSDALARPFHGPTVAFLAYSSFGLYLYHRLVFKAAIAMYYPSDGWAQVLYLVGIGLPAGILVGYAVQRGYDRVLARWSEA